ncbi:MarR family winged helix-turn-helix transcriptional regulator [Cellulomonas soli]|uniref:MarR family winged helix-turn-helix transcriptional regulator n=1 Tax=Cellulomonas soli TaxID=931535 RepID=UPI003F829F33
MALVQLLGPLRRGIHRVTRADGSGSPADEPLPPPPQVEVLRLLAGGGSWSTGALAERLELAASTLSNLLRDMEGRGLVERARVPDDQRRVVVSLRSSGRAALRHHDAHAARVLGTYLATLSEGDQVALRAALPALARLTDALGGTHATAR